MHFLPNETDELEKIKLKEEILKVRGESRVVRWNWLRFMAGSLLVPILIAGATYLAVYKSGYLNDWQIKNEIAQHDYKRDTANFGQKSRNSLKTFDSITFKLDSTRRELSKTQQEITALQTIGQSGLSKDQQVNELSRKVISLSHQRDSVEVLYERMRKQVITDANA